MQKTNPALLFLLSFVAACDGGVDASELERELRDVVVELREMGAEMRAEFIAGVENARDELAEKIEELRYELENNEELKRELEEQQRQLAGLIADVKEQGAEAWEQARDAILAAAAELEQAIEEIARELR